MSPAIAMRFMAPWLRVVLWLLVIVLPGGMALLPLLVVDVARRKALAGKAANTNSLGEGGA